MSTLHPCIPVLSFFWYYSDLSTWVSSMMPLVSSTELANDVGSAETLLERHQV